MTETNFKTELFVQTLQSWTFCKHIIFIWTLQKRIFRPGLVALK